MSDTATSAHLYGGPDDGKVVDLDPLGIGCDLPSSDGRYVCVGRVTPRCDRDLIYRWRPDA